MTKKRKTGLAIGAAAACVAVLCTAGACNGIAKTIGLPAEFCRKIIARTDEVVSSWLEYAAKCGINEERAAEIQRGITEAQN